eukprot:g29697.t1
MNEESTPWQPPPRRILDCSLAAMQVKYSSTARSSLSKEGSLVDSLFGEDDFFREARWDDFHECYEGSSEHDDLFHAAQEQAWIKCTKGTLAASYASFELHRRARRAISAISNLSGARNKGESQGSMYSCITCDAIKSNVKAWDIVGRLVPVDDLPSQENFLKNHPSGTARWTSACPLPRVICMNLMLPYETGIVPWRSEDPGASFVAFFHIAPETVLSSMSKEPPPEIKQLIDFFQGPAGLPGGPRSDPDRSLASRLQPGKKKDIQLCSYRDMIPKTKVHFGFLVQGIEDDELPEGLMCDVHLGSWKFRPASEGIMPVPTAARGCQPRVAPLAALTVGPSFGICDSKNLVRRCRHGNTCIQWRQLRMTCSLALGKVASRSGTFASAHRCGSSVAMARQSKLWPWCLECAAQWRKLGICGT